MYEKEIKKRRLDKLRKLNSRRLGRRVRKAENATIKHAHRFVIKRWSSVREVQRHIVGWVLIVGVLVIATGVQLMWYQDSYKTEVPAEGGTYAEAMLGPLDTLNPLFASSSAEQSASQLIFSRLISYDQKGDLSYDLARNISINKNRTVYDVEIKPGVVWHDGEQLTAKDVVFTVDLIKDSATRTTISGWQDIEVEAVGESVVRFTLRAPYVAFKHVLNFPVLPEHILGDVPPVNVRENNFSTEPIGSGPFKFGFTQESSRVIGRKVVHLTKNDDYYAGVPKLARFQLKVYQDTEAIVRALSLNEVNAATDLSSTDIGNIDHERYESVSIPVQSGLYAIINTKSPIMSDKDLRSALRLATDTSSIRDTIPAKVEELFMPITEDQIRDKDIPKAPRYSNEEARKVLDSSGWRVGDNGIRQKSGEELRLSVAVLENSEFERVLDNLILQWREVGISVETQVLDTSDVMQDAVQSVIQPRGFDVLVYPLNIGADPDVYAYWHSSQATTQGFNFANYSNTISDESLTSGRTTSDQALRNAKYATFVKRWLSDVPAIGLYQMSSPYIHRQNVKTVSEDARLVSPAVRYANIKDWSVGTQTVYKTP